MTLNEGAAGKYFPLVEIIGSETLWDIVCSCHS